MKYAERDGRLHEESSRQDRFLEFLYSHAAGRLLIKPFTGRTFSKMAGWFMNTPVSACLIGRTIAENRIDMSEYEEAVYRSYNDFFTRRIRKETRPISADPMDLVSPSDGKVTVYPITEDGIVKVKHTGYTAAELLRDGALARRFLGGTLYVIRLTVDNYHHYCYAADGKIRAKRRIRGCFHTVNPIANDFEPIYKENTREYVCIRTDYFGEMVQMEVGAMCVGKIVNDAEGRIAVRGGEKGHFEFGGSTILLFTQKDAVRVREDLKAHTADGYETKVLLGETIGTGRRCEVRN